MKLSDKIIKLRKAQNWSQENLAEKLNVSRQAISRWENGTALPDSNNVLQLSKLFDVSADYLLNDEYSESKTILYTKNSVTTKDIPQKDRSKLFLVATIAFLMAAFAWLIQAINHLDIVYVILAVSTAILACVNLYFYEKNRKKQ